MAVVALQPYKKIIINILVLQTVKKLEKLNVTKIKDNFNG